MIKELRKEKEKLDKQILSIEKKMKKLPMGKLRCITSNGTDQYFVDKKYVSKKKIDFIKGVCEFEYYEKLLPEMIMASKKIEEVLKLYDENTIDFIFNSLPAGRKSLLQDTIYKTADQRIKEFELLNADSDDNKITYEIDTDIYTNKGEHVRSKSEKIIADTLQYYGVPYKYEHPLELWGVNGNRTIYPDFTVYSVSGAGIKYVEHLGMMDDESYYVNAMNKLSLYESNDLLIGRDVIIFHETKSQPLNTSTVNKYIEEYLL